MRAEPAEACSSALRQAQGTMRAEPVEACSSARKDKSLRSENLLQGRGWVAGHLRNVAGDLGQLAGCNSGVGADPGVYLPRRRAIDSP